MKLFKMKCILCFIGGNTDNSMCHIVLVATSGIASMCTWSLYYLTCSTVSISLAGV